MKYLIVVLMWAGFGVIHSILIDLRFSNWAKRVLGPFYAFYRLGYNLLSLVLFLVMFYITKTMDTELMYKFIPPWTILQQILLAGSGVIIIWAFLSYDILEFVGISQLMTFNKRKREDFYYPKTMSKKGLLGIVRHPIYFGTIVFMWSLNSTRMDIITHLILTIYILIGIQLEERKLVKEFGSAYIEYQREVPALIPFTKKLIRN